MVFRIKLMGYSIFIWLLSKFIWLWDVYFTFLDNLQMKLWHKLKLSLTKHRSGKETMVKDEFQKNGIDSWN